MAKVISIDPPKSLLARHSECGALIQYELREVLEKYYKDWGGGGDTYYESMCPNCGKKHQWIKRG